MLGAWAVGRFGNATATAGRGADPAGGVRVEEVTDQDRRALSRRGAGTARVLLRFKMRVEEVTVSSCSAEVKAEDWLGAGQLATPLEVFFNIIVYQHMVEPLTIIILEYCLSWLNLDLCCSTLFISDVL